MLSKINTKLLSSSIRLLNHQSKSFNFVGNKNISHKIFVGKKYLPENINKVFRRFNSNIPLNEKSQKYKPVIGWSIVVIIIASVFACVCMVICDILGYDKPLNDKYKYISLNNIGYSLCDCDSICKHMEKFYSSGCTIKSLKKEIYTVQINNLDISDTFTVGNYFGRENIKQLTFQYHVVFDINETVAKDLIQQQIRKGKSNSKMNEHILSYCKTLFDVAFKEEIEACLKQNVSKYRGASEIKTNFHELNKKIEARFHQIVRDERFILRKCSSSLD